MGYDFFGDGKEMYHASSYFFRVEFQARGAPHIHSLLWLKDSNNQEAPSIWTDPNCERRENLKENEENLNRIHQARIKEVERFADLLTTTSPEDVTCIAHEGSKEEVDCDQCKELKEKVSKYQTHNHTFTCAKKGKVITVKEHEGHGILDGRIKGPELEKIQVCRFKFPKFPLDETKLIFGITEDIEDNVIKARKKDLNKIIHFLIRQTHTTNGNWSKLKSMNFYEFLYSAGMFAEVKHFDDYSEDEKQEAKKRYLEALSVSVQGKAMLVLKREVKDIFVNAYNVRIMQLFKANHDLQICIDPYAAAQYICGYLTKNESGMSKLLKAVDEETNSMNKIEKLNALAAVLDKHREVSIQEAVYRILGLQMTKSSVKVKYLSTLHPHFRDGLLRGNIEELSENEPIFHKSAHQYYENRPEKSINPEKIDYDEEELQDDYWVNLCLAEFWSKYEIVYGKIPKPSKKGKTKIIPLKNGYGYIRKRSEMAVLRYYLNYENNEDLARGLLILFMPFTDEMKDIHCKDVEQLLFENRELVEEKRSAFEKYKLMSDLIRTIQRETEGGDDKTNDEQDEEQDESSEIESTCLKDIEEFNKWAKTQASRDLSKFKNLTSVCDLNILRSNISSLNKQQRRFLMTSLKDPYLMT